MREEVSLVAVALDHDAHDFRFIISPERVAELDIKSYIQGVMAGVEMDLG